MNIYQKIAQARIDIANKGMSKTGKNSYAGYNYFELGEILPAVNEVANKLGFLPIFRFERETAILDVIDSEKPEDKVSFTFCYSENGASLKGCHPVQNDGATQTYIKRYLYQNAFEIAESDALDSTTGKEAPKQQKAQEAPKQQQQKAQEAPKQQQQKAQEAPKQQQQQQKAQEAPKQQQQKAKEPTWQTQEPQQKKTPAPMSDEQKLENFKKMWMAAAAKDRDAASQVMAELGYSSLADIPANKRKEAYSTLCERIKEAIEK